jgi:hypothetical protein
MVLSRILQSQEQQERQSLALLADEVLAFDQWVEEMGWAAKRRAEGKAEWEAEGEKTGWKKVLDLLQQGHTVEELERTDPPALNGN